MSQEITHSLHADAVSNTLAGQMLHSSAVSMFGYALYNRSLNTNAAPSGGGGSESPFLSQRAQDR